MEASPKFHNKLQHSKHAAVSLDSLLGVLASAYGTEELDSNSIFDTKNTVNWRNISVEHFKSKRENVEEEIKQKSNRKELNKSSVSTSTSNLKQLRNSGSKIDLTLVSIKSLEDINQHNGSIFGPKNNVSEISLNFNKYEDSYGTGETLLVENTSSKTNCCKMENIDENCNRPNVGAVDEQHTTICGFFVESSDGNVIFDIQFYKSIQNIYFPNFHLNDNILITVTDVANQTKSFIELSKSCMISKCSYFAEIDKEYSLENLEVCVKCNIPDFNWVATWLKTDTYMCKQNLTVINLKAILLIAYNLKIHCLVEECLDFFNQNLKSVLEFDRDIEYLFTENLSIEFVKRISNTDINEISDEFESFKIKMFCALIKLLADGNIYHKTGHYSTLATIFQCASCEKLLNYSVMSLVPCSTHNTKLDFKGELKYLHECLPVWNLTKYIELIFEEFQNWKLVYWYLWGICHFLYCTECQAPYPLSQSEWCPYHPNDIGYFPMNSDLYHPIGSFTCCGEKAFKFSLLQHYSGCKFKSHTPCLTLNESKEMYTIYELNKHLISSKPSEIGSKKFVKFVAKSENDELWDQVANKFWWDGIQLAPKEKKDNSIIAYDVLNRLRNKRSPKKIMAKYKPLTFTPQVHFRFMPSCLEDIEENSPSQDQLSSFLEKKNKPALSVSKSILTNVPSTRVKSKSNKSCCINQLGSEPVWSSSLSIKDNQENQRDFEEVAMTRLVKMLSHVPPGYVSEPMVGTYVRIESEWWREHCSDSGNVNVKTCGTVVNRTYPLSWFKRPPM